MQNLGFLASQLKCTFASCRVPLKAVGTENLLKSIDMTIVLTKEEVQCVNNLIIKQASTAKMDGQLVSQWHCQYLVSWCPDIVL